MCIMLPWVRRWNKPGNAERQALVVSATSSLAAVKIGPEAFDQIAEGAMNTPWIPRNPRPIAGAAQVREILELAA